MYLLKTDMPETGTDLTFAQKNKTKQLFNNCVCAGGWRGAHFSSEQVKHISSTLFPSIISILSLTKSRFNARSLLLSSRMITEVIYHASAELCGFHLRVFLKS